MVNDRHTICYLFFADTGMKTEGLLISQVNSNISSDMIVAKDLKPATCVLAQMVIAFLENG